MTRVRVEVQDDDQIDIPHLRQLPGVSGYVKQGAQHQIIVGPGKSCQGGGCHAPPDCRWRRACRCEYIERTKSEAKAKYKAPMSDALRKLANVFIPLIPALYRLRLDHRHY